jgi:hypothetical protein
MDLIFFFGANFYTELVILCGGLQVSKQPRPHWTGPLVIANGSIVIIRLRREVLYSIPASMSILSHKQLPASQQTAIPANSTVKQQRLLLPIIDSPESTQHTANHQVNQC